jgi:ParB/RepB/Spo0J family partition protein
MNIQDILTSNIHVPAEFGREKLREDEQLTASIRKKGVEQPLIVLASEGVYKVIKGTRRLAVAKALGIPRVPCVVHELPKGEDEMAYMRRLRFIADEHRQDLLPTQRAELVEQIKATHGFTDTKVAAYLGVVPDTIANWTDILRMPKEVQEAVDSGKVKLSAVRPLRGLKPEAQAELFLRHQDDFASTGAERKVQKRIEKEYPPSKVPELYVKPQVSAAIRARPKKKRVTKNYSHDEKRALVNSLTAQEDEVEANKLEIKRLRDANVACVPVVNAILRNAGLKKMVPEETLYEITEWSKKY